MSREAQKLTDMIAPSVTAMGYELLGCELCQSGSDLLFRVYIDTEKGILVDDCEKVSRQISAVLDVEDPIKGEYRLEVSSPGWERPLFTLAHYQQFVGERAKLKTYEPVQGRKNFTGVLVALVDQVVQLKAGKTTYDISFNNIQKGHLAPLMK